MMRNRPLYAFDAEEDTLKRWHVVSLQVAEELRTAHITPLFRVNGDSKVEPIVVGTTIDTS